MIITAALPRLFLLGPAIGLCLLLFIPSAKEVMTCPSFVHDSATLRNKKLRYREEHSASIVLNWCTLWHFSTEKSIDG